MPYTPPSQQSPASSKSTSPVISRSSSYSEEPPRSPGRPQPPRSSHSASYLTRHRRSPSISKSDGAPPIPTTDMPYRTVKAADFAQSDSVRQSPPPVNNHRMPTGAVLSPPDSSENSDGDETNDIRGRDLATSWDQLKEAVRAIDQRREGSPERDRNDGLQQSTSEPASQSVSPTALTAEARKISHSRSSTETSIMIPRTTSFAESPIGTSDDSDEDQSLMIKPSLVRKKSGELVKPALRPSSRRRYSSMPGTPTYSKSVHFNDNDNQTRHFLQVDKPIAVSAGTSPVETYDSEGEYPFEKDGKPEREIKLTNFPADSFERQTLPVRVERIFLSQDKQTLIGTVAVQNISFHKLVIARFTLDYWKTTSEVVAEYNNIVRDPPADGCDRFNFHIKLSDQANIDTKTLLLCARYTVGGTDYWDNNSNTNYQIDFVRNVKKVDRPVTSPGLGARPLNALPRSKHSPSRGRPESVDDDFASRLDTNGAYSFGNVDNLLGESGGSIKLKPKRGRGSLFQNNMSAPAGNGLGGRYDFGASLSAALSTAQDKLGRQSGLMNSNGIAKASADSYFAPLERKEGPTKTNERPDALTTDRPAMGSDQYRDLVQKFCYFTPGAGKSTNSPQISAGTTPAAAAASDSETSVVENRAVEKKPVELPSPTKSVRLPQLDGASEHTSATVKALISRSTSPARKTGHGYGGRASSPISFGYPYHSSSRDGYLSDSSVTPTAIHG